MTKKQKTTIGQIVGVLTLISIIGGGVFLFDDRYAKAAQVNQQVHKLHQRLEQKIQGDKRFMLQQRIWQLEDRFPDGNQMPQVVKEQIRLYREEIRKIDEKMKKIGKGE